jgi:hypothetical protein
MNHVALSMTMGSGSYHVDWGDGTSANFTSGGAATHQYTYSDAALGNPTSEGFKVAIITVTPVTSGQAVTAFSINLKSSNLGSNNNWSSGWLDLRMSFPSISVQTNFNIGNNTSVVHRNCKQFEYIGDCALTAGANLFIGYTQLESLKIPKSFTANMTNMASAFSGLSRLRYMPDIDTSAMTSPISLFANNTQLRRVPACDYSHCTSMSSVFQNCSSLEYIPDIGSIGNANTTSSLFAGCASLLRAPALTSNTSLALTTNMFLNCSSLKYIPTFTTTLVTNVQSMFQGCSSLAIFPALDFSAVNSAANLTNTFTSCFSMSKLPISGLKYAHTLPGQLSGAGLDAYYTLLGTAAGAQTLTVTGNFTATDTPSIATAKGWSVSPP